MGSKACSLEDVLVVSTSKRGEKISTPLSKVGVNVSHFRLESIDDVPSLYRLIQKRRPKVVIVDSFGFAGATVAISTIFLSIPYVIRARGDAFEEHKGWIQTHISNGKYTQAAKQIPRLLSTRLSILLTDNFIFVSEYLRDKYNEYGESSTVIHTPCLVSNECFDENTDPVDLGDDTKENIVLAVTNMHYPKKVAGLKDALDPISQVLANRDDTTLLIAGDGPYRGDIISLCSDLSGDVRVLGYIENIEKLYNSADVFVHFSYLDGFPSTILEAYATRTAVLANNSVGMQEQVNDGETGYLVDLDDRNDVISKLTVLLDSPEQRNEFAAAGHNYVKRNHTSKHIGRQLRSYLMNIVDE